MTLGVIAKREKRSLKTKQCANDELFKAVYGDDNESIKTMVLMVQRELDKGLTEGVAAR